MRNKLLVILIAALGFSCSLPNAQPDIPFKNLKYQEGRKVYEAYCQVCHGAKGEGLRQVYPPLAHADFLANNWKQIPCYIQHGLEGEITVNGKKYNAKMLPNHELSELQIADLMTFLMNSWSFNEGDMTKEEVRELIKNCEK